MDQRLYQQQSQKLVLSPQIRQYLKLLQLPLTELSQAIETELVENPLLEEKSTDESDITDSMRSQEPSEQDTPKPATEELRPGESFEDLPQWLADSEGYSHYSEGRHEDIDELQKNKDYSEGLLTKPEALSDYLLWQIRFLDLSEAQRTAAEEIIGNIDENGFLQANLDEIASAVHAEPGEVLAVLHKIQGLEPPGIGARTLQEALLLQIERKKSPEAPVAREIVEKHLPLLEKRDWPQLARLIGCDLEKIRKSADLIARLEPRPGRSFYAEETIAVTPDAIVTLQEDETPRLKVEIVNEKIPELRINAYYRSMLRKKDLDEKTKVFLKEKLQAAIDFMKALQQRKSTLHGITDELVKEQGEFFEKGFSHLRPLRLKDIAGNLGIHESTVSRAISGKHMQTPQGTIPYRSFFSTKLETTTGEEESQKSIMMKLKSLIEAESPEKPLSDQELVVKLKAEGIVIARRTVAKYRDLLKILPSHLRRKR